MDYKVRNALKDLAMVITVLALAILVTVFGYSSGSYLAMNLGFTSMILVYIVNSFNEGSGFVIITALLSILSLLAGILALNLA